MTRPAPRRGAGAPGMTGGPILTGRPLLTELGDIYNSMGKKAMTKAAWR